MSRPEVVLAREDVEAVANDIERGLLLLLDLKNTLPKDDTNHRGELDDAMEPLVSARIMLRGELGSAKGAGPKARGRKEPTP